MREKPKHLLIMTSPDNDEHIIETIGKTRICVRNGEIIDIGKPAIETCPLAERFAIPVHRITPEAVSENFSNRISSYGMCTPERQVRGSGEFVGFGASELISAGLNLGILDCAVIACDGAGTVIVKDPELVQGIGGRMSGLVKTSPIPLVIEHIEREGGIVLDPGSAKIDQEAGVVSAHSLGYRNVAVTTANAGEAARIRSLYPGVLIIAVHTTGISREEAEEYSKNADLITACASYWVREIAGRRALLQAGNAVPVFAMTKKGKNLVLDKLKATDEPVYVKTTRLPVKGDVQPHPLI